MFAVGPARLGPATILGHQRHDNDAALPLAICAVRVQPEPSSSCDLIMIRNPRRGEPDGLPGRPSPRPRRRLDFEALEGRDLKTNILLIGNSYTDDGIAATQIPQLIKDIAAAAGRPDPTIEERAVGGHTLLQHAQELTAPTLRTLLGPGQSPDYVVIQGQSLEAGARYVGTASYGEFLQGAVGVARDVRNVFPGAHFILYETWARNSFSASPDIYPDTYAGPDEMQDDLKRGYLAALGEVRAAFGKLSADLAPAGEAFRQLGFADTLYRTGDAGAHPAPRGALAAALSIYSAVFDANVSAIPAARAATLLQTRGLAAADWLAETAAVDRATGQIHATQDRAFVQQAYLDILGRAADAGGLDGFTSQLVSGVRSRSQVVEALVSSDEYRINAIQDLYRNYLGRDADPPGQASFLAMLRAGSSIDEVRVGILGSSEYFARSGQTNDGLVRRLYVQILHRNPSSVEVSAWLANLNGGTSRVSVAISFVNSLENRRQQVANLYTALLGRSADALGLSYFSGTLMRGEARYEQVLTLIAGSLEAYNRFA